MADFVISVFNLRNARGYFVPLLNIEYVERGTGLSWVVSCGGTRGYAVRHGEKLDDNLEQQAADSHFMMRRVESALLLGAVGLFHAVAAGRLIFRNVHGELSWTTHLDWPDLIAEKVSIADPAATYDWFSALTNHTVLRRAADDAHLALSHPHEALIFVYRGFEWLVVGMGVSWEDLANDVGVSVNEIRDLKKTANVETGVRHAAKSGIKMRASSDNYGSWVCGLFDAINAARARLESGFAKMTPEQVGHAVARAIPAVPYE